MLRGAHGRRRKEAGTYADVVADGVDFLAGPFAEPVAPHLVEHLIHAPLLSLSPFRDSKTADWIRFGADGSIESNPGVVGNETELTRALLVCCAAVLVVGDVAVASSERGLSLSLRRSHGARASRTRALSVCLSHPLPPVLRELGVHREKDRERQRTDGQWTWRTTRCY